MATWIWFKIDSGTGLLPDVTKQLPTPIPIIMHISKWHRALYRQTKLYYIVLLIVMHISQRYHALYCPTIIIFSPANIFQAIITGRYTAEISLSNPSGVNSLWSKRSQMLTIVCWSLMQNFSWWVYFPSLTSCTSMEGRLHLRDQLVKGKVMAMNKGFLKTVPAFDLVRADEAVVDGPGRGKPDVWRNPCILYIVVKLALWQPSA